MAPATVVTAVIVTVAVMVRPARHNDDRARRHHDGWAIDRLGNRGQDTRRRPGSDGADEQQAGCKAANGSRHRSDPPTAGTGPDAALFRIGLRQEVRANFWNVWQPAGTWPRLTAKVQVTSAT